MHISTSIALSAPTASFVQAGPAATAPAAPPVQRQAPKELCVWAQEGGESLVSTVATATVGLLASGLTLALLAHAIVL